MTAGDDRVIAFGKGRVALFDAMAPNCRELGRIENLFRATCYPHVAIADGVITVKDMDGNLMCFDTRKRAAGPAARN